MASDTYTIHIEKLVMGGMGLGRLDDGIVVLVPHVLPGETVVVSPVQRKKNYLTARVVDVLESASERAIPPCPYYGRCGGCDLQHVHQEKQIDIKNDILLEHMTRSGVISSDNSQLLLPPVQPGKHMGYRQRIRLHVDKLGHLGYHHFHSHEVVPIERCLLAVPKINEVLSECLRQDQFNDLLRRPITGVEFQHSELDDQVALLLHMKSKLRTADIRIAEQLVKEIEGINAIIFFPKGFQANTVFGEKKSSSQAIQLGFKQPIHDNEHLKMHFEAGGFCQVNQDQNSVLISLLMDWANLSHDDRVLDLFCGMGNFTLPLAKIAGEVVGVDLKRSSIRSAKKNAEENNISNCIFKQQSAGDAMAECVTAKEQFDLILLDPPRQGCAEVISSLAETGATQIIYISCDPATLSRDLLLMKEQRYEIEKMQMIDMFPQTHHMETIVKLKKV